MDGGPPGAVTGAGSTSGTWSFDAASSVGAGASWAVAPPSNVTDAIARLAVAVTALLAGPPIG